MDDARDMLSRDATAVLRERKTFKGKKLYNEYAMEEIIIAISSKVNDDMEPAKRLGLDPPSPKSFARMVRVKPKCVDRSRGKQNEVQGGRTTFASSESGF